MYPVKPLVISCYSSQYTLDTFPRVSLSQSACSTVCRNFVLLYSYVSSSTRVYVVSGSESCVYVGLNNANTIWHLSAGLVWMFMDVGDVSDVN